MHRLQILGKVICVFCAFILFVFTVSGLIAGAMWILGMDVSSPMLAMFTLGVSAGTLLSLLVHWVNKDL